MSSSYRNTLDQWLAGLDVSSPSVLDIGGSQLPVKNRVKSWNVGDYKIADLASPHTDAPAPDFVLDLNYLKRLSDRDNKTPKFDLVFCLEVFEYIWNPYYAFQNIWRHSADGATIFITFPFFYPTHQPIEADSLRYTEWGIRKLAIATHFKVVQMIRRRPETDALLHAYSMERMRAAKNYDHAFTGWIVELKK